MPNSFSGIALLVAINIAADEESPKRPHSCSTHISGGAGRAIIQALDALRELTDEQRAHDGTHAPRNERRQHGKQSQQADGLPRALRNLGQPLHRSLHQRAGSDHIAADDNHHHLHGEGDQRPKSFAALNRQIEGLLSGGNSNQEDSYNPDQCEHQRIRKPALAPVGKRHAGAR